MALIALAVAIDCFQPALAAGAWRWNGHVIAEVQFHAWGEFQPLPMAGFGCDG